MQNLDLIRLKLKINEMQSKLDVLTAMVNEVEERVIDRRQIDGKEGS